MELPRVRAKTWDFSPQHNQGIFLLRYTIRGGQPKQDGRLVQDSKVTSASRMEYRMYRWIELRRLSLQLRSRKTNVRRRAIQALSRTSKEHARKRARLSYWEREHTDIGWVNRRTVGLLIRASADADQQVRATAQRSLQRWKDAELAEPLMKSLDDSDWRVRVAAVNALAQRPDSRVVEPLIKAVRDRAGQVRVAAVGALAHRSDDRVIESVNKALNDRDGQVRVAAVKALAQRSDGCAIKSLIKALGDREGSVRVAAVGGLAHRRDSRVIEPLITALSDSNEKVSLAAVRGLANMDDPRVVQGLVNVLVWGARSNDVDSSGSLTSPYPTLSESGRPMLSHDEELRYAAACALEGMPHPRAKDPTLRRLILLVKRSYEVSLRLQSSSPDSRGSSDSALFASPE